MLKTLISKINYAEIYYILTLLLAFLAPLSWKMSRFLIILIILSKLLQFDYNKFFKHIKLSKALMVLLVFLSYQFITLFWTQSTYQEAHDFIRGYLLWLAIPVLASTLNLKQIKKIITVFLIGMSISEIIAYGMYFGFWTIDGRGADYPSPFMHHTSYSIFMAFTAIILLNRLYANSYNLKEKLFMGIFFLTVVGNLFISQGRIGQLTLAITIIIAGVLHFKFRVKTLLVSMLIVVSLFSLAYQASPMFQDRVKMANHDIQKIKEGNFNSSWGIRVAYIVLGSHIIKENPVFGVGLEDTKDEGLSALKGNPYNFEQEVIDFMEISFHFHNQYLMTALQGGIIGLILLLAMFYFLLKLPISNPGLKRLNILFVSVFIIASVSDPFIMYEQTRVLFILFSSLFIAASLQKQKADL